MSEHYKSKLANIEAIDVIEAFDLPRNLANVCKYILRAGKKESRERDLEKAIDYLWRERYGTWAPNVSTALASDMCESWCGDVGEHGWLRFCTNACACEARPTRTRKAKTTSPCGHIQCIGLSSCLHV